MIDFKHCSPEIAKCIVMIGDEINLHGEEWDDFCFSKIAYEELKKQLQEYEKNNLTKGD